MDFFNHERVNLLYRIFLKDSTMAGGMDSKGLRSMVVSRLKKTEEAQKPLKPLLAN